MTQPFWPTAVNSWGDAEREVAHRVIDSGNITMGEEVAQFEREFAAYVGAKYAVMVNSGSSANLLAVAVAHEFLGLPLNHGFDAVVPAVAWATTYAPLAQHGFGLRVTDVDPLTLNASARMVEECIGTQTRLIVGVSVLGNPAPLGEMRRLADAHKIMLIEDNCESLGSRLGGKQCGTFGDIGTFSTFFSHQVSTGEGGMLVTDNGDLWRFALCLRAHGWTRNLPQEDVLGGLPRGDYRFLIPGYNLRPTEIAAAVGRVQLRRLPFMIEQRLRNWGCFTYHFANDERWTLQRPMSANAGMVPFAFTLVFPSPEAKAEASAKLWAAGIEHRMITGGCFTEHPAAACYRWAAPEGVENAKKIHYCGLFVGNHAVDLSEQIAHMREVLG